MTINPTVNKVIKGAIILGSASLILNSAWSLTSSKGEIKNIWAPILTILIAGSAITYNVKELKAQKAQNQKMY